MKGYIEIGRELRPCIDIENNELNGYDFTDHPTEKGGVQEWVCLKE